MQKGKVKVFQFKFNSGTVNCSLLLCLHLNGGINRFGSQDLHLFYSHNSTKYARKKSTILLYFWFYYENIKKNPVFFFLLKTCRTNFQNK